jgi:hypothetical protein
MGMRIDGLYEITTPLEYDMVTIFTTIYLLKANLIRIDSQHLGPTDLE